MYDMILARYGEIGLKGKNKGDFIKKLLDNLNRALSSFSDINIRHTAGRIYITGQPLFEIIDTIKNIPGLVSISPAVTVPLDMEEIKKAAPELVGTEISKRTGKQFTFKVETRRANKNFPVISPEINRILGAVVLKEFDPNLSVDVHNPEILLQVEVRFKRCYLYLETIPGPGGLPVGSGGRGILLLSGGIDSPAAGWLGLKRGLEVEAVHFDSHPFTSKRARRKVFDLAGVLAKTSIEFKLHIVPFTELQKAIKKDCPEPLVITVMRRMMYRLAEGIAKRRNALAMITGESLGQVSSQTLENLHVIDQVAGLPVLRPLIGMDKTEIMDLARDIGTYDISIQPYEDCCTLFVPEHPATKPATEKVEAAENSIPYGEVIDRALENTDMHTIRPGRS